MEATLSGNSSMGIYANKGATVTNYGIVTVNGDSSQGVYLNRLSARVFPKVIPFCYCSNMTYGLTA